jgi:hypothetical protein
VTPEREEALRLAQDWFNEDAETVKDADLIVRAFLALATDLEAADQRILELVEGHAIEELTKRLGAAENALQVANFHLINHEADLATAREGLLWLRDHRDSPRFHSVLDATLRSLDGEGS